MTEIFDNIRKLYQFQTPCEELAELVEFFSETSADSMHEHITTERFTVKLFPSFTPTIWINLGSPYLLKNGGQWQAVDARTDVLVMRNEIIERNNLPSDNIFTIKFFPGAFEAILGHPQTMIGSNIIDATEVIPVSVINNMKRLDGFEDRMALIQSWLINKRHQQCKVMQRNAGYAVPLSYVQKAERLFCETGMIADNKELARNMFLTDKTLYRYFTKVIGTNPKNYLATVRARAALSHYVTQPTHFSVFDFGYYDRSHFYKDVLKFTGQKLSAFFL